VSRNLRLSLLHRLQRKHRRPMVRRLRALEQLRPGATPGEATDE